MHRLLCGRAILPVLMGLLFAGVGGHASAALVTNPGFEDATSLPGGNSTVGYYGLDNIPGWNTQPAGRSGVWQQGSAPPLAPLPGSTQSLFVGNGGIVFQDLSLIVQTGLHYTLSVYVGDRSDLSLGGGSIGFFSTAGEQLATQSFPGDFVDSGWAQLTLDYFPDALDIGKTLRVELQSNGQQVNFDNVAVVATPLPGGFALLASSLFGIGWYRVRRRR